jgi:hypothetical protein
MQELEAILDEVFINMDNQYLYYGTQHNEAWMKMNERRDLSSDVTMYPPGAG